jgi:EmrB/QacA subfamily drug resistance transporter
VLAAGLALDTGSYAVVNSALPSIADQLSMNDTTLQWMVTSYALFFAGFLLFGGRAADVAGRRLVFGVGVGLFGVCSVLAAVATAAWMLTAARAGQGLGAALSGPASLALVTQLFPEGPSRNRAFGIYTAVGASSFSIGLVLGGVLTGTFGWRSIFIFSAVIAGVVLAAVPMLPPSSPARRQRLDIPGVIMASAGLVLCVYGVNQVATSGWESALTWTALIAGIVLLLAFVSWESRAPEPLLPFSIFQSPAVRAATITAIGFFTALLGVLFYAPLYMQEILGYTPLESGAAILPMGVLVAISANVAGRIMGSAGQRPLMVGGVLLIVVGAGLWARTPVDGTYWVDIFPGVALMSVGQGLAFAALTAASMTGVPQERHGVASAFNVTTQQVAGSVGVAVLVTIAAAVTSGNTPADRLAGYHAAYLVGAAVAIVCALLVSVGPLAAHHGNSRRPPGLAETERVGN